MSSNFNLRNHQQSPAQNLLKAADMSRPSGAISIDKSRIGLRVVFALSPRGMANERQCNVGPRPRYICIDWAPRWGHAVVKLVSFKTKVVSDFSCLALRLSKRLGVAIKRDYCTATPSFCQCLARQAHKMPF